MNKFRERSRLYEEYQRVPRSTTSIQQNDFDESEDLAPEEEGLDLEDYDYDPHAELQHRRAQLDNKLKSTFESIFAKYERNFDGIGDEIDLATGEIVVNNGHLLQMLNERDAGLEYEDDEVGDSVIDDSVSGNGWSDGREGTSSDGEMNEGVEDSDGMSEEQEDEDESEGEEENESTTGDSMDDDDMILRGFTQANRFMEASPSPDLGMPIQKSLAKSQEFQRGPSTRQTEDTSNHGDIIHQFGTELGTQIVNYISEQEKLARESHIEPAWRVPELPKIARRSRTLPRNDTNGRATERVSSPEASTSVWAIPGIERMMVKKATLSRHQPIDSESSIAEERVILRRNDFTQEEDETMLDYIAKAQQAGRSLYSVLLWKQLAAQYPRHTWGSWQARYRRKFYIAANSEEPVRTTIVNGFEKEPTINKQATFARPNTNRPTRVRKPAQRDSRIISWSEAVNTIAQVDPELHAGLVDDARQANHGEISWTHGQQQPQQPLDSPLKRPTSANGVSDGHRNLEASYQKQGRRMSDSQLATSSISRRQHLADRTPGKQVPCPHSDCRSRSEILYGIDVCEGKDASDLTLHLLAKHRTTPYPCEEPNCTQKGGNGYFTQRDLIEHVRSAHHHRDALLRLRQRVESAHPSSRDATGINPAHRGANLPSQSFLETSMYLQPSKVTADQSVTSSTPGVDHALNMADVHEIDDLPPVSTPPTSYSSLGPAISRYVAEIRDSQEPVDSSDPAIVSSQNLKQSQMQDVNTSSPAALPSLAIAQNQLKEPSGDFLTTYEEAKDGLIVRPNLSDQRKRPSRTPPSQIKPLAKPPIRLTRTPNSKPSKSAERMLNNTGWQQRRTPPENANVRSLRENQSLPRLSGKETFTRNIIPASHDFSDEEEIQYIPKVATQPDLPILSNKALGFTPNPSRQRTTPLPSLITPPVKKSAKGPVQRILAEEDADELSMSSEDLEIVSSHVKPSVQPYFGAHPTIKRESTVGPTMPSATSKKRKIIELIADDEVDELGADVTFGRSTGSNVRIKKESDVSSTPTMHQVKAQRKQMKKKYREEAKTSGLELTPQTDSSAGRDHRTIRSGTPLLDLTPSKRRPAASHRREIQDSHEPVSSAPHMASLGTQASDGLLTPTRGKRESQAPLMAPAAIVVKTPRGTLRRCGEGDFRCGRSFCFRCGTKDVAGSVDTVA